MPWFIFFLITWILAFVLVPLNKWKRLWPAGAIGMAMIYAVDISLIKLGAYSFTIDFFSVNGIPLLYWLSGFVGPILLLYYYPVRPLWRLPYVLLWAAVLTAVEMAVLSLGYFRHYENWSLVKSYLLTTGSIIVEIWLVLWLDEFNKKSP